MFTFFICKCFSHYHVNVSLIINYLQFKIILWLYKIFTYIFNLIKMGMYSF